jgi:hypothetical protein
MLQAATRSLQKVSLHVLQIKQAFSPLSGSAPAQLGKPIHRSIHRSNFMDAH